MRKGWVGLPLYDSMSKLLELLLGICVNIKCIFLDYQDRKSVV